LVETIDGLNNIPNQLVDKYLPTFARPYHYFPHLPVRKRISDVDLKDLDAPGFRFHKLKKPPLDGYYSIDVSGNFRIVFWFQDGKASEVDY